MRIKIKLKEKEIEVRDVERCGGVRKFTGLMFKNKETYALLFDFNRPVRQAIHSFFCPEFLAVWLDNKNRFIECKIVCPNRFFIRPTKKFSKLLEIPLNNRYFNVVKSIAGKEKI
jgi:uncharacterized membrane protein (UPF0127 family)